MRQALFRFGKTLRKYYRKILRLYRQYVDLYIRDRSLRRVERFMFSWLAVFILITGILIYQTTQLASYYLTDGPRPGGRFVEGVVGEPDAINPIFSGNRISRIAEALIFQSLFDYNGRGELEPELAESYDINEDGTEYIVSLRADEHWHDGETVTAGDVVYTFKTIQNPDTGSSLRPAWQDIKIQAVDARTVRFKLPNPFVPFLHQLTTGIVPAHILRATEADRLRVAGFNRSPIGSGKFRFSEIDNGRIRLEANPAHDGSSPKLKGFDIAIYPNRERMVNAYNRGALSAMVTSDGLDTESVRKTGRSSVHKVNSPGQVFAFVNTDRIPNAKVRRALALTLDRTRLVKRLPGKFKAVDSPLLPGHPGYIALDIPHDPARAGRLLDKAGWKVDGNARRRKGEMFTMQVVTQETRHYTKAAEMLADQWRKLGARVDVEAVAGSRLQQDFIRPRNYDVLLFGVSVGKDPDVYAYWHSSQVGDTGRNLSQYRSETADSSLEDGRTRFDRELRAAKYETFQQIWRKDMPAIPLYRLHDYYVWRNEARGIQIDNIAHTIDRFHNVEEWTIRTKPVLRRLHE